MSQGSEFEEEFEAACAKIELVKLWQNRMWRASLAHYVASDKYRRWHAALTIFNMVAAISVLFLSNNELIRNGIDTADLAWSDYLLPIASLLTVLSSAVHYLVRFQERAEQHKQGGNEFSSLKRSIEKELTNKEITKGYIEEISMRYDAAAQRYPHVPRGIWRACMKRATTEIEMSADTKKFWQVVGRKR
ncbi:SLATT domain-containing protein [Ruegeria sp. AD91A]|uniref:SLATT domain-containing protein n=1 Tax=Ruegeria sp. AD91A TaxID=2293862 RepID=UPI000E4EC8C7|nr:SLATT domain-containing protein [Ruegeria sp. AD91A]AXT26608.1 SLATT domain-containing protein [Ruegeria sp. AD91A]